MAMVAVEAAVMAPFAAIVVERMAIAAQLVPVALGCNIVAVADVTPQFDTIMAKFDAIVVDVGGLGRSSRRHDGNGGKSGEDELAHRVSP